MSLRRMPSACLLLSLLLVVQPAGCGDAGDAGTCACPDVAGCDAGPDTSGPADAHPADTGAPDTDAADAGADTAADALEEVTAPPTCPWLPLDDGIDGGRVPLVQFDPRVSGIAFATSGPVLFRSSDSGRTWERWAELDTSVMRLGFPSGDPKALLAIGPAGVWESHDSGLSFELKSLGGLGMFGLLVHPALDQRVFVGTDGAGIFRSDDLGGGWRPHNVGVPRSRVRAMAGHPTDPDVAVVGVNLQNEAMGSVPAGQLLVTVDGGRHWDVALDGVGWGNDIAWCEADPAVVWAAVRQGLARSDDGGLTWTIVDGLGAKDTLRVAVDPADCDAVWVAVYREGIYRSVDGGATAEGPFSDGLQVQPTSFAPEALVVDPADPARLFAATHGGLYASEDGGETWALTEVGDSVAVASLRAAPAAPGELWMTTWGSGTWVRRGLDTPWTRISVDVLPRDFTFSVHPDPDDPDRVFVGTSPDLWVTEDGGDTFTRLDLKKNVLAMAFLRAPDQLLAGTQVDGFYLADDNASVWTSANADLQPWETANGTFIDIRAIVPDPHDPALILAGTRGRGILRTADRGASWTPVGGEELAAETVRVIVRAEVPSPRWFALADAKGVYVSYDDGLTWARTGTNLDSVTLKDLAVDPATGYLYLATADTGIYRSVDGVTWSPFDRYCQPVLGYSDLAIVEVDDERSLVAVGARNTVIRHVLDPK